MTISNLLYSYVNEKKSDSCYWSVNESNKSLFDPWAAEILWKKTIKLMLEAVKLSIKRKSTFLKHFCDLLYN